MTGLAELRSAVQKLPEGVTTAFKRVAHRSAQNIAGDAKRSLLSQLTTDTHKLADAIEVVEDAENRRFSVVSKPPAGQPANITIWNEYGTSKMAARPYMRPAGDRERIAYMRESEAAAVGVVREALE